MKTARPPAALISSVTSCARLPLKSATTTAAPSTAKRRAVAAPMPAPPAVTIATRSFNLPGIVIPDVWERHSRSAQSVLRAFLAHLFVAVALVEQGPFVRTLHHAALDRIDLAPHDRIDLVALLIELRDD